MVMEMTMSEEDQMMRAIAMSLGENILMSSTEVRFYYIDQLCLRYQGTKFC